MKLDRVTITGPDDSIEPESLLSLTQEFPFVEWGILVSENNIKDGCERFPSLGWLQSLFGCNLKIILGYNSPPKKALPLSMHLCGSWVRELLLGRNNVPGFLTDINFFSRIQLNFHAEHTPCNELHFYEALEAIGSRQFIFQIDGNGGNKHLETVLAQNEFVAIASGSTINAVPLFDISGGAGILPTEWPAPKYQNPKIHQWLYHGYAGGLGPQNLEAELPKIFKAAGDARIWIDMETHVRSNNDKQFDLEKVRHCLEICKPFI